MGIPGKLLTQIINVKRWIALSLSLSTNFNQSNIYLTSIFFLSAASCPFYSSLYTGWGAKANEECFVLIYPLGQTDPEVSDGSCFSVPGGYKFENITSVQCCCNKADDLFNPPPPVDPYFLRATVEGAVDYFNNGEGKDILSIDTTRIYMAGHSNGCMTSLAMGALHSDIVAAVCCHAGTMVTPFADNYSPVPTWMVHGRLDTDVGFEESDLFFGFGFPGLLEVASVIADKNGCADEIIESDVMDGDTVVGTSYKYSSGCTNGADVELVALSESGHVPYKDGEEYNLGAKSTTIDTTAMAWDFCSSYAKESIPPAFIPTPAPTPDSSVSELAIVWSLLSTVSLWMLLLVGY